MRTEIFRTEFQARRAAKLFFASVLGISPESVHVKHDSYYESRGGSTQCVCGETRADYFFMSNAGPRQQTKLETVIGRPGAVVMYGVCECCGEQF